MIAGVLWPAEALTEALGHLGVATEASPAPPDLDDADAVARWVDEVAAHTGFEAQHVLATHGDIGSMLRRGAPALLRCDVGSDRGFVVLLRSGRSHVRLLGRDLGRRRLRTEVLARHLQLPVEHPFVPDAARATAPLPRRRQAAAQQVVVDHLARNEPVGACWLLRPQPGRSVWAELSEARVLPMVAGWLTSHIAAYGLWIGSWVVVGRGALQGRLEPGWLLAWAAILISMAPLRALTVWLQGAIAVRSGVVLKQRLLAGALRLSPDDLRTRGVGTLLGRVEESVALERMALTGGMAAVLAATEWVLATAVLWGAGATLHAGLGIVWLGLLLAVSARMLRDRRAWTHERVSATHTVVEKLIGHRTRTIQDLPEHWHLAEDDALTRYGAVSRTADGASVALTAVIGSWTAAGVIALTPSFVAGTATVSSLAVAIGGVLLVARALDGLAQGLSSLVGARIAWEQIRDLWWASADRATRPAAEVESVPPPRPDDPVLEGRGLCFRYPGASQTAVSPADLRIGRKDRVLIQGPSGGGKSTLASLLMGLRLPTAGILLLDGLDRPVWGETGWRSRITGAPQFHENHILAGTLAFNLLLGRRWPPTGTDLTDAEGVCMQLGLGPLLDNMPGRLQQLVGETGWQLSHGERSRVYLARALLQEADVLVLDESFGALDAQAVEWCLYRAHQHPGALVVVAHP